MLSRRSIMAFFGLGAAGVVAGARAPEAQTYFSTRDGVRVLDVEATRQINRLTLRREKGMPLTADELDDNFAMLSERLDRLEFLERERLTHLDELIADRKVEL